jgi:hypothetical protein
MVYTIALKKLLNHYKIKKEDIIKKIAEEYKDLIPYKLYEVMIKYQVEIGD